MLHPARGAALGTALLLSACVVAPVSVEQPRVLAAPVTVDGVPAGMQYLYGSGEAAAISVQAWRALTTYVAGRVGTRMRRSDGDGVVLAPDATLADPRFLPCAGKPFAAVFDVDETVVLNRGFERDAAGGRAYEEARWKAYELTGGTTAQAVPGAVEAIRTLRAMGVAVVFNTNRSAANGAATVALLDRLGLGPAVVGDTLYLADAATGSRKDGRRAAIATRYCVVAMGGDQLGDFSDLFNAGLTPSPRRAAATAPVIAGKWGAGWFVLPNPVYGTALKGRLDEVFPADSVWSPEP
jgi:5'-nucleotidase (lipoprotein e(P4) family)